MPSARASPPADVPSPMLARLARELPEGAFAYEPKWDGLRCIAAIGAATPGPAVHLRSRHARPLTRYFPDVVAALATLPPCTLDGELVVRGAAGLEFDALLLRVHPSASRVERLAREKPATFVAFDLLARGGASLVAEPLAARRAALEALVAGAPPAVQLTPATRDPALARAWLAHGGGIDGVVAKALDQPYLAGKRGWVKVKRERTADCVAAGMRLQPGAAAVASLLLGLWDGPTLRHVGVASSFTGARRRELLDDLRLLARPLAGHPWEHGFGLEPSPIGRLAGSAGRWDPAQMTLDWTPLAPVRVAEVAYDQLDGSRFRHPARLVRWRPDREARSCELAQLRDAP